MLDCFGEMAASRGHCFRRAKRGQIAAVGDSNTDFCIDRKLYGAVYGSYLHVNAERIAQAIHDEFDGKAVLVPEGADEDENRRRGAIRSIAFDRISKGSNGEVRNDRVECEVDMSWPMQMDRAGCFRDASGERLNEYAAAWIAYETVARNQIEAVMVAHVPDYTERVYDGHVRCGYVHLLTVRPAVQEKGQGVLAAVKAAWALFRQTV